MHLQAELFVFWRWWLVFSERESRPSNGTNVAAYLSKSFVFTSVVYGSNIVFYLSQEFPNSCRLNIRDYTYPCYHWLTRVWPKLRSVFPQDNSQLLFANAGIHPVFKYAGVLACLIRPPVVITTVSDSRFFPLTLRVSIHFFHPKGCFSTLFMPTGVINLLAKVCPTEWFFSPIKEEKRNHQKKDVVAMLLSSWYGRRGKK